MYMNRSGATQTRYQHILSMNVLKNGSNSSNEAQL